MGFLGMNLAQKAGGIDANNLLQWLSNRLRLNNPAQSRLPAEIIWKIHGCASAALKTKENSVPTVAAPDRSLLRHGPAPAERSTKANSVMNVESPVPPISDTAAINADGYLIILHNHPSSVLSAGMLLMKRTKFKFNIV